MDIFNPFMAGVLLEKLGHTGSSKPAPAPKTAVIPEVPRRLSPIAKEGLEYVMCHGHAFTDEHLAQLGIVRKK